MARRFHAAVHVLNRHPVSLAAVLVALAAVAAAFTFARPRYQPKYENTMINLAEQEYLSPSTVRAAFVAEGLPLQYSSRFMTATTFSNVRAAKQGRPGAVLVTVAGRTAKISFGPELTPYDARFENVLVTYDGRDQALLDRIKAAVAALDR